MAKLFSKYGASAFGEAFVSSYELEKKINERRQELEQEYNFKRRQMSLDEAFRREQVSLGKFQEERLRERQGADIENMYVPIGEKVEGSILGSELQERYPTLGKVFKSEQYYLDKDLIQKQPEKKKFGEGIIGGRKYSTWGVPGEEEVFRYDIGEGETKGGKDKIFPELTEKYEKDAFARLKNPQSTLPEGLTEEQKNLAIIMGQYKEDTPDQDFTIVTEKLLSGKNSEWLNNYIRKLGGYPSPQQLVNGIIEAGQRKPGQSGYLTPEDAEQFENYLQFYSQFEQNLRKPELPSPIGTYK